MLDIAKTTGVFQKMWNERGDRGNARETMVLAEVLWVLDGIGHEYDICREMTLWEMRLAEMISEKMRSGMDREGIPAKVAT